MSRNKLLNTSTFRQALAYMALFALSVLALLSFLYWHTASFIDQQTDKTIIAEIRGLDEQFRRTGLIGLIHLVRDRSRHQRLGLYHLRDKDGRNLGGNLDVWPAEKPDKAGWVNFIFDMRLGKKTDPRHARARLIVLPAGYQILVGHDIQSRFELEQRLRSSLVWAVVLTLVFGLTGGLLLSRSWLARVEAINQTSAEIMAGDMDRRVPLAGKDDELDMVARKLNAMLDRIQDLMESLHQVTDNIAHNLRSPLNRMRGNFEVLLLEDRSLDEYRHAIGQGIEETDELLNIFDALLSIAKAESGNTSDNLETTDLGELASEIAEFYRPVIEERNFVFKQKIASGVEVLGNPQLLSQALANLLENALKHVSAPGNIGIEITMCEGRAEAIIVDNGPGIPEHECENVLKRFYRLEHSRQSPGNGLGLSLVAAVAHIHGAEFSLLDAGPGLKAVLRFPLL